MIFVLIGVVVALLVMTSAVGAATTGRRHEQASSRFVYGVTLAASATGVIATLVFLGAGSPTQTTVLPFGLPWLGAHFRLDSLSALFLLVIHAGGAASSLYGLGYGRHDREPARTLPFFPIFLAAMTIVVCADDAFIFLFAWEVMSVLSWLLVLANHREAGTDRAASVYLVMASFGTGALLLAFGLLAGSQGDYSFAAIRALELPNHLAVLVLALTLLGAGSKAGMVPLHVWLPLAHPAAPSHVSALMSGVMTKVAIYAIIRVLFDLVGPGEFNWWWGVVLLLLGGMTAATGVLQAVLEDDLKRLLAYSTVENIGLILIGIGLAMVFRANELLGLSALAMTAALLHVLNHSLFKGLLFLGAGAVLHATGERRMDRLGGLIHRMPVTAAAFLVGAGAVAALPPLNGFVSEWMLFQALLNSPWQPQWIVRFAVPAVGVLMALAAALAATAFVKAYGITFLSRPRSAVAGQAKEVPGPMLAAMGGFAALCLILGVAPGGAVLTIDRVASALVGASIPGVGETGWLSLVPVNALQSVYGGLALFLVGSFFASLAVLVIHRWGNAAVRRAAAWDCGFPWASSAGQYTASSFSQPIRRVFGSVVLRAHETVDMPEPGEMRPASISARSTDPAWAFLFSPLAGAVERAADVLNRLQSMTIRRYLMLMFAALVILLFVVAVRQ